ncbi:spheroidene monooxygenase [Pontibacter ummariensis]|uniref:Spheroidene monooxygenase n=1 Tax=Pontibacter ummariensis TaxID=1610492 RepID=A0A239BNW1_9BACT|nr:DUF3291 domain-containing protein [Pontibacter ummariensis]PRY15699.1 spheroidene monooxygenase [Pontibacter ummariensis]SNS09785.1 spheroidene monooxygenase [Pontibacter ummariensis]
MQVPASPLTARLTTFTLFGIRSGHLRWGLAQMGTSVPKLSQLPGLQFFKLLGSGHGKGFSLKPNFRRYGLLCTWETEEAADNFFRHGDLLEEYRQHTHEIWTVKLHPYQSHGQWDGKEPFSPALAEKHLPGPVAVLTRASINWRALPSFWRFVPQTSRSLEQAKGLLCSIGVGELPLVRQATFSVWETEDAMKAYAYQNEHHQEVMRRTRAENWYKEELFARFKPLNSQGTWGGRDPLQQVLAQQLR